MRRKMRRWRQVEGRSEEKDEETEASRGKSEEKDEMEASIGKK